jgi:phosphoglycerol transferase MdoB-like AlkP superfamily enzyme
MNSLKSSFKVINEYLKEMKRLGVYKDATIVITGDHASPEDKVVNVTDPYLTALYVKESGKSVGTLKTSKAQVSHDDLWPTIFKSENLPNAFGGVSMFELNQNDNRQRQYFRHNFSSPMVEQIYSINGEGSSIANWKLESTKEYNKFIMD